MVAVFVLDKERERPSSGGENYPLATPCGHMGLECHLEGRDQLRELIERHAREIQ